MTEHTLLEKFKNYSDRLSANASANDEVIGLVFLGSAADHSRVDEWSDHDFYLVVKNGLGEKYRNDLGWIPDIEHAILTPRETAHGLKVVFDDGRVLEFAVFEDNELELSAANHWMVSVDKQAITERMQKIAERSRPVGSPEFSTEFELFLAQLLIGVGRFRRGEVLTAGQFIRSYIVKRLITLTRLAHAPVPGSESKEDNLDGFRRFELQYPSIARRIEDAMQATVETAAQQLLKIAIDLRPLSDRETQQVEAIRQRLSWN